MQTLVLSRQDRRDVLNQSGTLPAFLSVRHIAAELGVTPSRVYQMLADPAFGLPCVRYNRAVKIPRTAWEKWLQQQSEAALSVPKN